MRLSIVLKTLAILPFIYFSKVHAELSLDAAYNALPECIKNAEGVGLNLNWKSEAAIYQQLLASCAPAQLSAFKAASDKYLLAQPACVQKNQSAGRYCLEKCSPDIQKMISASQLLMTGLSQSSIVDSCSKMGSLMNIAQMGMSAFSANCGAQKLLCDSSCGSATAALAAAQKALSTQFSVGENCNSSQLNATAAKLMNMAEAELNPQMSLSVAAKQKECGGYVVNLTAAGAGILSAAQQMKKANACEEDTKGDQVASLAEKCSVAANKNLPECICKNNPRSPGCELAADLSNQQTSGFGQVGAGTVSGSTVGGGGLGGLDSDSSSYKPSGTSGPNGAPSPVGGGGGSAGLGGGALGSNDGRGAGDTVQKMNTGIYGGEGGGGGGAFGSRGGGSAAGAAGYNSSLRDKIAAEREIASLRSQVTSQGGKSNWEKVKDRYTQEKINLLGR